MAKLSEVAGVKFDTVDDVVKALDIRLDYFHAHDARLALINIHGKKIYLASDIGEYGALKEGLDVEVELAKTIGKVDVYKVAHHGYMTYQNSLTALQYLEPAYSIVNNDESSNQIDGLIDRIKFGNENYKKTYFTSNGHVEMTFNSTGTISIKQ